MDTIPEATAAEAAKPFDKGYVLRTTAKHMRKSIDISIRKTFDRMPEFTGDPKKSSELFETLAHLHTMRNNLDAFQKAHAADFQAK